MSKKFCDRLQSPKLNKRADARGIEPGDLVGTITGQTLECWICQYAIQTIPNHLGFSLPFS